MWGGAAPILILVGAWRASGWSLAALAALSVLWTRIYSSSRRRGVTNGDAANYATHCVLGKVAGFAGTLRFAWNRVLRRRPASLIQSKGR